MGWIFHTFFFLFIFRRKMSTRLWHLKWETGVSSLTPAMPELLVVLKILVVIICKELHSNFEKNYENNNKQNQMKKEISKRNFTTTRKKNQKYFYNYKKIVLWTIFVKIQSVSVRTMCCVLRITMKTMKEEKKPPFLSKGKEVLSYYKLWCGV